MIKILLLLPLIYFISCEFCRDVKPNSFEDCLLGDTDDSDKCCFFYDVKTNQSGIYLPEKLCFEVPIGLDSDKSLEHDIKQSKRMGVYEAKIDCEKKEKKENSSYYLKIGVLLIICLLF